MRKFVSRKNNAKISRKKLKLCKKTNDIYFGEKNSAGAVEPAVEI